VRPEDSHLEHRFSAADVADCTVKVLDFGLAKALAPDAAGASNAGLTQSPTITSPVGMTGVGMLLGTAAYMSPEQARGRLVDKRADIWAFGCVLYEVLTGRKPFVADEVSDTLAMVLMKDPDWSRLPAATPLAIRTLLRRCLEKDRKRRLPDIGVARLEIEDALAAPAALTPGIEKTPNRGRQWLAWAVAAVAGAAAIGIGALHFTERPPEPSSVVRFEVSAPQGRDWRESPLRRCRPTASESSSGSSQKPEDRGGWRFEASMKMRRGSCPGPREPKAMRSGPPTVGSSRSLPTAN